jgi:capsular exopolysaccharide synthesis family protein
MINRPQQHGAIETDRRASAYATAETVSLAEVLWRGRWIVLLSITAVVTSALVYVSKVTPIYVSTSKIYVEQSGPRILNEADELMTESRNYVYTQAELLKSTPTLLAALDKPEVRHMKMLRGVDSPVAYLKKEALEVVVGKKDDIISISCRAADCVEAAQLANAVVDCYIAYNAKAKHNTADELLRILQTEKAQSNRQLAEKLQAMMDFKKEHLALAFETDKGNIILQRLERLSTTLTEAQLATIENKSIYQTTQAMLVDPTDLERLAQARRAMAIHATQPSERAELRMRLDQLNARLLDRSEELTPDHPAIRALQAEVTQVKEQLANLDVQIAQAALAMAEQAYSTAKDKEAQIAQHFEEQRQLALELNELNAQYAMLESEWEQTKKLCDILDDRIKEIAVNDAAGAMNISVLEVARPADEPSEPQKGRIVSTALVLGLLIGCGGALLRERFDQRLRSAEEIAAVLELPILGVVPSMSNRLGEAARGRIVHTHPSSAAAEAYRTIRTGVFFSVPKDQSRSILVTSPAAGDGKTTLVSNLAIAMAQAGQRVLVIDADFRKPAQHTIFALSQEPGLANALAGTHLFEATIRPSGIAHLDIVPCGPEVINPAEMLGSEAFASFLRQAYAKYDRILVDAPPVMPVADARILAAACDAAILVLRADKSTRKTCRQARDILSGVDAHVIGVVVNDVTHRKNHYGYCYYGGYSHQQNPNKDSHRDRQTVHSSL